MLSTLVTNAAASVLLTVSPTPLADVYVDQSASNCTTGTGASTDPVCSIGAAIALASPGDTLRIAAGTYFENLVLNFDLELVGSAGASATIINGGANGSVVTIPSAVTVTLDGLTITNGRADYGGGIQVEGNVTILNSRVVGNRVVGDEGTNGAEWGGGGIGSINGGGGTPVAPVPQITIKNSTISSNSANYPTGDVRVSGGAMYVRFGEVRISGSTISDNTSRGAAGGILVTTGYLNISNSTLSGNLTQRGGGGAIAVSSLGGNSIISNTTITNNHAPTGYAGGVSAGGYSSLQVRNSVIAGNTSAMNSRPGFDTQNAYGCFTSLGNNFIGSFTQAYCGGFTDGVSGDQVGTAGSPSDPMLGPLQDNGGGTQTHLPLPNSPLIDNGDTLNFLAFDQRGVARPIGSGPDIGSVESSELLFPLCNGDGGDQVGCTDCPCGNNAMAGTIGGCLNSTLGSARLTATGNTSVSLPSIASTDLRFSLEGTAPFALAILNSGQAIAPVSAANPCFGLGSGIQASAFDGLRCAVQNSRRHGGRAADGAGTVGTSNDPWGGEGLPASGLAQAFGGFLAGEVSYFQVVYRDDPLAICARGLNTSQALQVTFTP